MINRDTGALENYVKVLFDSFFGATPTNLDLNFMVRKMYLVGHFDTGSQSKGYFFLATSDSGLEAGHCMPSNYYYAGDPAWSFYVIAVTDAVAPTTITWYSSTVTFLNEQSSSEGL